MNLSDLLTQFGRRIENYEIPYTIFKIVIEKNEEEKNDEEKNDEEKMISQQKRQTLNSCSRNKQFQLKIIFLPIKFVT